MTNRFEDVRKILVVNLGGIGDILLSTPALRALKERYPVASVSLLTIPRSAEAARDLSYIDKIYTIDLGSGIAGIAKDIGTILSLRKMKFDLAINMRTIVSGAGACKMEILFSMIGARVSAGRNTDGRGGFFDIKINEPSFGAKYEMEYDIELVEVLGATPQDRSIDLTVDKIAEERVDEILKNEHFDKGSLLVGIHPGGALSHRWPVENFSKVIDILAGKNRCVFAITGSFDERILAEKIKGDKSNIINLSGKLNFKELAAFIKRCDLYITNDTAPMHIAAILNTPVVAIFGPGYLERFDPKKISSRAEVLCNKIECAPCARSRCDLIKRLESISPDDVARAAFKLLDERKR
jgi:heptosyltransferase-2